METVKKIALRISSWLGYVQEKAFALSGMFIWAATILVTANVIGRYFLNRPISWVFEITQYILVWFTFLSIAWILRIDRHIKVEVLTMHLSRRGQIILDLFSDLIGLLVTGLVTVFGAIVINDFYLKSMRETSPLQPPSWPIFLVIFLGAALTLAEFIKRLIEDSRALRELSGAEEEKATGRD
ncbi:MAG: TRAP transporter small permease [Pseudomonadota bacterium]